MLTFKADFSFFQGEAFTLRWRRWEKGTSSRHVKKVSLIPRFLLWSFLDLPEMS